MRHWWIPALILLAACGDDNNDPSGPGITPEAPATLSSTSLDGAIALVWSDNPFQNNPDIFGNYQIYGASFDIDTGECGTDFAGGGHHGGAGVSGGRAGERRPAVFHGDRGQRGRIGERTVAPARRHAPLRFAQHRPRGRAGHREQLRLPILGRRQPRMARWSWTSWAWCGNAGSPDIDFFVDRDGNGDLFLTPVRAGTGVEYYDEADPVQDLTSIDFAPDFSDAGGYRTSPIQALPGFGYVFEMDGGDGFPRYGAVRVQHVGSTFLILDWAYPARSRQSGADRDGRRVAASDARAHSGIHAASTAARSRSAMWSASPASRGSRPGSTRRLATPWSRAVASSSRPSRRGRPSTASTPDSASSRTCASRPTGWTRSRST